MQVQDTSSHKERLKRLGYNIKIERVKKLFKQETLAELALTSRNTISVIENGVQNPSILLLLDIAAALDVDISVLVDGV